MNLPRPTTDRGHLFWFFSALGLAVAQTASPTGAILPTPTRVSGHVYAWIGPHGGPNPENKGFRMNMGFVVGKDAVAVIEAGYHKLMAREMLQHIAKVTPARVKYVINTNSQPEPFLGNEYFRHQGALVNASAAEAKRMAAMGRMFAEASEHALRLKSGVIQKL